MIYRTDVCGSILPATEETLDRRGLLRRALALATFAGGFIPTERSLAQSVEKFDVRRPMVRPLEMWLYTIHMPPEFPSTWIFGFDKSPAIPADFFGAGSDPWAGPISCVGIPLNPSGHTPTADLVVRHEAISWVNNPTPRFGPREIPQNFRIRCEMKQLSERVPAPITVSYNRGQREEKWDTLVTIAKDHPGGGYIDLTWISPDGAGGLCDIEIAVKVDFTFTRQSDKKVVILKSDVEWLSETNHPFARRADAQLSKTFNISPGAPGNFIPATRVLSGETMLAAGKSCNDRVAHSFTLAPKLSPQFAGKISGIKQFAPRKD